MDLQEDERIQLIEMRALITATNGDEVLAGLTAE